MTGIGSLFESDATLRLAVLGPEVALDTFADSWQARADTGGDSLVLIEDPSGTLERMPTVCDQARSHLTMAGWTIPDAVLHGGQEIPATNGSRFEPASWFEMFHQKFGETYPAIQTVRSPQSLVDTLEACLIDGVIPAADGWPDDAIARLQGDRTGLRQRCENLADSVPAVDTEVLLESFAVEPPLELLKAALESYLAYRLDRGAISCGQLQAYASQHEVESSAGKVLLVSTGRPSGTAIDIARDAADHSMTVAVTATPSPAAISPWPATLDELSTQIAARVEDTRADEVPQYTIESLAADLEVTARSPPARGVRAGLLDQDRCPATVSTHLVTDPIEGALDFLEPRDDAARALEIPTDGSDLWIVVPTPRHARRLMRLANQRSLQVARAGQVDVFRTRLAVLSLAWLRILKGVRADRGWAVVLEEAGCSPGDIEAWLAANERPAALAGFKSDLASIPTGPAVINAVADRYGTDGRTTHAVLTAISGPTGPPTTAETLRTLDDGIQDGHHVQLEPPASAYARVATCPPQTPAETVVHVDTSIEDATPALVYVPPLGVHRTRRVVSMDGHALERPNFAWETRTALLPGAMSRRQWRAIDSLSKATNEAIVVTGSRAFDQQASRLNY